MLTDRETVRAALPALRDGAYLNTGGAGPLAAPAAAALAAAVERSLAHGRMTLTAVLDADVAMAALRDDLARLLAARSEQIAVTVNTTHGVNCVGWGIDWRPGDVAVTTALEHPGLAAPLRLLAERLGVRVEVVPAEEASADLAGAVARRADPGLRLVALSHVAYGTGEILDVEGAAREARRAGALTLVDGAQSVGAMEVRPDALGIDALAFPSHKWLLGPEGLGGLWLSDEALARVRVTFGGYESGTDHAPDGSFTPFPGARRLELSTPPLDLVAAWRASLAWLAEVGWERVFAGTAEAAARAREVLAEVEGATLVTPPGAAGLVAFTIAGADPPPVCRALAARGVAIRWIDTPSLLRLSAGFFTDEGDLRRLAEGLSDPFVTGAGKGDDG